MYKDGWELAEEALRLLDPDSRQRAAEIGSEAAEIQLCPLCGLGLSSETIESKKDCPSCGAPVGRMALTVG